MGDDDAVGKFGKIKKNVGTKKAWDRFIKVYRCAMLTTAMDAEVSVRVFVFCSPEWIIQILNGTIH